MTALELPLPLPEGHVFPNIEDADFKLRLAHYVTHTKGGYFLRKHDLQNQACYVSAVVYILIGMYSYLPIEEMTETIKRILNFRNLQTPLLRNIIGSNTVDVTSIQISTFDQLDSLFEHGIVFLGLATPGDDDRPNGTVQHYCLILRRDGKDYIVSSYGSSDVAMRQSQIEADPIEVDIFFKDLAKEEKTDGEKVRIRNFMEKYFLAPKYRTIQRKTEGDVEDTYPDVMIPPDDPKWRKNQSDDIAREIGHFQGGPINVMAFQNMLGTFKAEVAALRLIDAMTKWRKSADEKDKEEYESKYREWNEINQQVLEKLELTKRMLEEAAEPIRSQSTPLGKIDADIRFLTPTGSEASTPVGTPKRDSVESSHYRLR